MDNDTDNNDLKDASSHRIKMRAYIILLSMVILCNFIADKQSLFVNMEYKSYDLFLKIRNQISPPSIPEDIVIVAIDEPSMQEFNLQWPWPRKLHADLTTKLHEAGAAIIGFDIVFSEPSDQESDTTFAEALGKSNNVVLAEDIEVIKENNYQYTTAVLPIPDLENATMSTGLVWISLDEDGFVRRINLNQSEKRPFSIVVAENYLNITEQNSDSFIDKIPNPVLINYLGVPRSIKTVSYYQALNYKKWLGNDFFKDKIVLIGISLAAAPNHKIQDHFFYPFLTTANQQISGVEIHANLIDTLLRQRFIDETPIIIQWLIFLITLLLGAYVLVRKHHWLGSLLFCGLIIFFYCLHLYLFINLHLTSNVVTPIICLILFLFSERVYSYAYVDREKRFIKKAFSHYISPAVVSQLIENPERLNLSGEYYETTVLFTDLVGFTTISEEMEPMKLRTLLTEYFGEMVDVMLENKGTLDKFIGDAMMCFYGVPIRTDEHPKQAVSTAWDMQQRLTALNKEWTVRGFPEISMRIGVNSGRVVAGNMGTKNVFNYTIMGDPVNLGARLESANKQYGTNIMIGETTYEKVQGDFHMRWLDCIRVKGKNKPVSVYELQGPIGTLDEKQLEKIKLYELAFSEYQKQNFQVAIDHLDKLLKSNTDEPSVILRKRCHIYIVSPPRKDWDGVYTMTRK
jgi:adenylate cyclase